MIATTTTIMATPEVSRGWELHQAKKLSEAEQCLREAVEKDPNDALALCYLGMVYNDQNRLDDALKVLNKAITLTPGLPIAYHNIGNTLLKQERLEEALQAADQAIRLKSDYTSAHALRGAILLRMLRLDAAAASYQRAHELQPGDIGVRKALSVIAGVLGRHTECLEMCREIARLAPEDTEAHLNLSLVLLRLGEFEEGWREYEYRWDRVNRHNRPIWDGSSLDGKTILLDVEQGLGDIVNFIRYAAVLKERYRCRVIVKCRKQLIPLLRYCPGVDHFVKEDVSGMHFDTWIQLLSLPRVLGHNRTTDFPSKVPYLSAEPALVETWRQRLSEYTGVKVGIVWQGSKSFPWDMLRSVPLSAFAPLGKLQGVTLISLQFGYGTEQIERELGRLHVATPAGSVDQAGAFIDKAAIIKNLDLVITVDTSIAHVAGALGAPVWIALPYSSDWRWMTDREDSPWYPTARLYRQPAFNDWESVFQRMAEEMVIRYPSVTWKAPADFRLVNSEPNRLVAARHGFFLYNRHDKYVGRSFEQYGEFSEGEAKIFRQMIRPGMVVVEAGANLGAHTLVLAKLVGPTGVVYAFEPQRPIFQALCANMALNGIGNVHARYEALAEQPGWITIPLLNYRAENNFGGLNLQGHATGERVPVTTIDSLALPRCEFIKADVEGMEINVLKGAAETIGRCRPILYVENDRAEKSAALIEYLHSLDYRLYWHKPPLFNADNYFQNSENYFGEIRSFNMIGFHSSVKTVLSGFPPVQTPDR
jgi:FkbM family methyltransferase